MPFLFFPSQDVLRLALSSGAVPREITSAPVRIASVDEETSSFWLATSQMGFELPLSLARFGVQISGTEPAGTWNPLPCWALALRLRPDESPSPDGPVLLDVPVASAASIVRAMRRHGSQRITVIFPERDGRCWLTMDSTEVPPHWHIEAPVPIEIYRQAAPHIWVQDGQMHPACDRLIAPANSSLLLRSPHEWKVFPSRVLPQAPGEFPLSRQACEPTVPPSPLQGVPVSLRLVPGDSQAESLWRVPAAATWERIDPALLRRFEAAEILRDGEHSLLVRRAAGMTFQAPFNTGAYSPHPRLANLFLPSGRVLHPKLREDVLAKVLSIDPSRITWLEETSEGGYSRHSAPAFAFRPLSDLVAFSAPAEQRLLPCSVAVESLALPMLVEAGDTIDVAEPIPELRPIPTRRLRVASTPTPEKARSWLGRSVQHWLSLILGHKTPQVPSSGPGSDVDLDGSSVGPMPSAAETLLHGADWSARRRELESNLVEDLASTGAAARCERWGELATVYSVVGNAADSALCWMNAIWDTPDAPRAWRKQWLQAEAKLARLPPPSLAEGIPGAELSPEWARLIAAWSFAEEAPLPRHVHESILVFLNRHTEELPLRAVWLALTRLCENDPLSLARGRDRLLARLHNNGPGLDLDEPSFLRSHGTAAAERIPPAREWLIREQEPIRTWLRRTVRAGRLRDVGLEAETTCTRAYIDLLLAWGLGCVGERAKSQREVESAGETLQRAEKARPGGKVHGVLLRLFSQRIREAQDGRAPKAAWPTNLRERLDRLNEFDRYCVDRLRSVSRILEPRTPVNAFASRNHRALLGTDRLGERLHLLLERTDPIAIAEEARPLLAICANSPRSDVVPRVVFALLEHAPHLAPEVVTEVLSLVTPALDWLETWLQSQARDDIVEQDLISISARMLERSLAEASAFNLWNEGKSLADDLLRRLSTSERRSRRFAARCAASLFPSLHTLRLAGHTEAILRQLEPGASLIERLGCAIGWFRLGRDDVGTRSLDEARDRLYLANDDNEHDRTDLAIAYAEALGAAPPRIAMGRLEELFQRLGPISIRGSTNSFFTLQPLRLIETVVRSVVGENFALGPRVQSWLEDDEFLIRQRIQSDMAKALREFDP